MGIDSNDLLAVHKGPGVNYPTVYKVYNGTGGIEILEGPVMNGSDAWVHILFTDREGWIRPKYLRAEEISASDKINFQRAVAGNNVPMAARYIRPEYVNEPFRANPDVAADYEAYPPVDTAALYGYTKLFVLLAEHGGDMKYRNDAGPLAYIAAARGHYDTAEVALRYGGGTEADIARGKSRYALGQINPNAIALGFALVGTAIALHALSDGSSASTSDSPSFGSVFESKTQENQYYEDQRAKREAKINH